MTCPFCKHIVADDSLFCEFCGKDLRHFAIREYSEAVIEASNGMIYHAGSKVPRSVWADPKTRIKVLYTGQYPISDIHVFGSCIETMQGEEFWQADGLMGDPNAECLSQEQYKGIPQLPHGTFLIVGTLSATYMWDGKQEQMCPQRVAFYLD